MDQEFNPEKITNQTLLGQFYVSSIQSVTIQNNGHFLSRSRLVALIGAIMAVLVTVAIKNLLFLEETYAKVT